MTRKLMAGDSVALRARFTLGRRRVHRVEGDERQEGAAEIYYSTMQEPGAHARNKLSVAQLVRPTDAVSGKRGRDQRVRDKITGAMVSIVKTGLKAPGDAAGTDQEDQGRRRLHARWTTMGQPARRRRGGGLRAGGIRGTRPSRGDGADGRVGWRDSGAGLRVRRRRPQAAAAEDPRRHAGRGGGRPL